MDKRVRGEVQLPWYLFHDPESIVTDSFLQLYLVKVQDHVLVVVCPCRGREGEGVSATCVTAQ